MQDHSVQPSAAITLTNTDISLFVLPVSRTTGSLFQITRATLPRKGEVEVEEEEEEVVVKAMEWSVMTELPLILTALDLIPVLSTTTTALWKF